MRRDRLRIVPWLALALAFASAPARAQTNPCVDCHVGNGGEPWPEHQRDWDLGAHSRSGVTCEKCHRGDASSSDFAAAHQGVLNSKDAAGPTHPKNGPETCGRCHPGPHTAFQGSKHHELLRAGDARAPTCSTCHGAVAARLPAPEALAAACSGCHGEGQAAPRPERAARAARLLGEVEALRDRLKSAHALIRGTPDAARRHRLEQAYEEAQGPLTQAIHAGHRFVLDDLEERLAVARRRSEALMAELASPPGR